ncbi:MAG: S8 family serine peptidase [Acidobacteria bacterium]|nr:S8 family serine peptidase [Acidobacteriota bacterium]
MIISIINKSAIPDHKLLTAIRAINRQITEDFFPYWSMGASLRLEGTTPDAPETDRLEDMRGDAVIYVWDTVDVQTVLGFHDRNHRGIPFGFVFTELSKKLDEPWSVTLSHEALELIADPEVNLLVKGPHPSDPSTEVFHWFEMCDAVQAEGYEIDGVRVSNFILPLYFTVQDEIASRNDFLGIRRGRSALKSFGVARGGYIGFFNPETKQHERFFANAQAKKRHEIKSKARSARRAVRYEEPRVQEPRPPALTTEPPIFESFAVRFALAAKGKESRVIENILGRGWKIQPFGSSSGAFSKVSRASIRLSVDQAWENTHKLTADKDNILEAEPLFQIQLRDASQAAIPGLSLEQRAAGMLDVHKKGTQNHEWALTQMGVQKAWDRDSSGTPRIGGRGVIIAHPDTGFTDHPEISARIRTADGFDFVSSDPDAHDDLVSGLGDFPGHGTGTASVIMSDISPGVSGVAPHAEIIPLRVSNSVIHLSMENVTQAIHRAIDRKAHVISMSLGGLPSLALHSAIRDAVNEGIIVAAAAGNYVGAVVWPARYDEVIAVAACNIEEEDWWASSRGDAVDVSAPGESVWKAAAKRKTNAPPAFDVNRSSGTSFATAHVAGIAALWLEKHDRTKLIAKYGKPGMVAVFKALLLKTARRPSGWDTGRFGAGIAHAGTLLSEPLPAIAPAFASFARARSGAAATGAVPSTELEGKALFYALTTGNNPDFSSRT